jgi:hypothetical protein
MFQIKSYEVHTQVPEDSTLEEQPFKWNTGQVLWTLGFRLYPPYHASGSAYLFSPRKSPPTPIGHLGERAHKVPIYDSTLFPIILYHHIREFH